MSSFKCRICGNIIEEDPILTILCAKCERNRQRSDDYDNTQSDNTLAFIMYAAVESSYSSDNSSSCDSSSSSSSD